MDIIEIRRPDEHTVWEAEEFGIRAKSEFMHQADRTIENRNGENRTVAEWAEWGTGWARDGLSINWKGASYTYTSLVKRGTAIYNGSEFNQFDDPTPIGRIDDVESIGLVVLFHGLNGQPSVWDDYIDCFNRDFPQVDTYFPEIPDGGHRSLHDDTTYVLLDRIVDWINRNPRKPVAFFGQSNGTRFAVLFETALRERAPQTNVYVSLSSAVLFGTRTVDNANAVLSTNEFPERSFGIVSDVNCEELAFGSQVARELVDNAREPLAEGVAERRYVMYSPIHDMLVPNTGSGLPILVPDGQRSKQERHYVVTTSGHNAIVENLVERRVHECMEWMLAINNERMIAMNEG